MEDQTSAEYLEKYMHQIGAVVIAASMFDYALASLLSECFCLSAFQENALLRPLGTRPKLDILQRIAKLALDAKDPDLKRVTVWSEGAKTTLNDRNTVIHGTPGHHDKKVTFRLYSGSKAFGVDPEPWPLEKVQDLCTKISGLRKDVDNQIRPIFAQWIQAARQYVADELSSAETPDEKSE
jgi:hypothetical protein